MNEDAKTLARVGFKLAIMESDAEIKAWCLPQFRRLAAYAEETDRDLIDSIAEIIEKDLVGAQFWAIQLLMRNFNRVRIEAMPSNLAW